MTVASLYPRRTITPSSFSAEEIAEISEFLSGAPCGEEPATPCMSGPDGTKRVIPARLYDTLTFIMASLCEGQGVTVMPTSAQLTTQKAADFLQMSRPTLVKLLESGEIPFTKVGRHRRVLLADVQEYEERISARRDQFLADQTREAAQEGDYFVVPDDYKTR